MKVIQAIEGKQSGEVVELVYYRGDNMAKALSAVCTAAADHDDLHTRLISVRLEM